MDKRIQIILHELKVELHDLYKGRLKRLILFGSYATGKMHKDSDIDLVILSKDFKRMGTDRRFNLLYHARENPKTWKIGMDIFGFTPEEFTAASPLTTLGEVKETGITIFPE